MYDSFKSKESRLLFLWAHWCTTCVFSCRILFKIDHSAARKATFLKYTSRACQSLFTNLYTSVRSSTQRSTNSLTLLQIFRCDGQWLQRCLACKTVNACFLRPIHLDYESINIQPHCEPISLWKQPTINTNKTSKQFLINTNKTKIAIDLSNDSQCTLFNGFMDIVIGFPTKHRTKDNEMKCKNIELS